MQERGASLCEVDRIAGRRAETTRFLFLNLNSTRFPHLHSSCLGAGRFEESIMTRGVIWLLGALFLSGLFIFALTGICSNTLIFPTLTGYFCPKPRMKLITVPQNPAPEGMERQKN